MQGYNLQRGGTAPYQTALSGVAAQATYPILTTATVPGNANANTAQTLSSYSTTQSYPPAMGQQAQGGSTSGPALALSGAGSGNGGGSSPHTAFNAAPRSTLTMGNSFNAGVKLFVGQVPAVCTEEQLLPVFAEFGPLLEIKIMRERNGHSKGSAWVRYENEESARSAIAALNEKYVLPPQTNALRVQFAAPNNPKRTRPQFALQSGGGNYLGSNSALATGPLYAVEGSRGYGNLFNAGTYNDMNMQYTSSVNRVDTAPQSSEASNLTSGDTSQLAMQPKLTYLSSGIPVATTQQRVPQQSTASQGGVQGTAPLMGNVMYTAATNGVQTTGSNLSGNAYVASSMGQNFTLNSLVPNPPSAQWRR